MKNILYFEFNDITTNLTLFSETINSKGYQSYTKLHEYQKIGIGHEVIDIETIIFLVENLEAIQDNSNLKKLLDYYYDSVMVRRQFTFPENIDIDIKKQLESLLQSCKDIYLEMDRNEAIDIDFLGINVTFTHDEFQLYVLERSGIQAKLIDMLERFRLDTINYPIDEIVLVGEYANTLWIKETINRIFEKDSISSIESSNFNTFETHFKDTADKFVSKELILRYKNDELTIMNVLINSDTIQEGSIEFKTKFSLDTHVILHISERWREQGVPKIKNIVDYRFYLPCFYTGDTIRLKVKRFPSGEYELQVIHLDTGDEVKFSIE